LLLRQRDRDLVEVHGTLEHEVLERFFPECRLGWCVARPLDNSRRVILQAARQALYPEIEGQVHQPAVTVGGDDAKPLFHRASSLDSGYPLPPVVSLSRVRAKRKRSGSTH